MSFREIKCKCPNHNLIAFNEKMRVLGYPKVIGLDSFRMPNFPLVSDILYWLCKRYDSNLDILYDISSEQDRVFFLKSVVTFFSSKAHVNLNPKKLYMADGYAVRELLKVANLLYKAANPIKSLTNQLSFGDFNDQLTILKSIRSLASSLTDKGAELFQYLEKEERLSNSRNQVISKPLDLKSMENDILESIQNLEKQKQHMISTIENLSSDQSNLENKINKKREEVARAETRLKSLQSVRPAYMDEYEKQEVDLIRLYSIYMERFRNLAFLEQQLDEHVQVEMDKALETDSTLKAMQDRIRQEEIQLLRGPTAQVSFSEGKTSIERPIRPNGAGRRHSDNNSDDDGSVDDSGEILSFGSSEEEEFSKADETHENASDESFIESRDDMDDENDF